MLKGDILYDQLAWERMYFTLSKAFHSLLFFTLKNVSPDFKFKYLSSEQETVKHLGSLTVPLSSVISTMLFPILFSYSLRIYIFSLSTVFAFELLLLNESSVEVLFCYI